MAGVITIRGVAQWDGSMVGIGVLEDNDRLDYLVQETLGLREVSVLRCETIYGTPGQPPPFVEITIRVVEPVGDERSEHASVTIDGRKWDGYETVTEGLDAAS